MVTLSRPEHDHLPARWPGGHSVERSAEPKLLIATRVFGASGQPWLWRQVVGLTGFRKQVLCWKRQNEATQPTDDVGVEILPGDPAPYDDRGRWLYRLRNLPGQNFYAAVGAERRHLASLFLREQPTVALCHFGDIAMRLLPAARQGNIPVVAYFHGDFCFVSNRWYRRSLLRSLRHFAAVVVVTPAEREWMLKNGVSENKLHSIPCGSPTDLFRPAQQKPGGNLQFAMVSRLAPEKGCDLSIRAFAQIAKNTADAQLQIYGDGPARQELQDLVQALCLDNRVFFHGYLKEQQLAEILPSCDIFLQHSLQKEGSPVSIAEAMACGLPVVATPVGGIAEQVSEGSTGFLVAERDVQGMAAAMLRLASDAELRRRFGQAGRARALSLYDATVQTGRLQQVLSGVVGKVVPETSPPALAAASFR